MWRWEGPGEQMTEEVCHVDIGHGEKGWETWQDQDQAVSGSVQTPWVTGILMMCTAQGFCSGFQGKSQQEGIFEEVLV